MAGKKDVLDDDDDRSDSKVDEEVASRVKEKVAAKETEDPPEPDEAVEVDLDAAEEELEPATEAQRESRRDKRRNRYREVQEERAAALRRAEEAERRESETRQLLLSLQQQGPRQPAQPEENPLDRELQQALAEQRQLYSEQNMRAQQNALTPEYQQDFQKKAEALQKRLLVLGGKLALQETQQVDRGQVRGEVIRQQMMQAHGDVLGQENTQLYCDGVWRQLRAKGKPDDWETLTEAAEITRKAFGMPSRVRRPPPSEASKRRLTGMPRGGGSADSGEQRVVTLKPEHKRMANALYKHIPNEAERYKRWAAGPGKRLLDKQAG